MTTVALTSVRGAPGVTATALLLAGGVDDALVVEADTAGGVIAVRYALGREPGLSTLAASRRADPDEWRHHAQVAGGVAVLVGPDSPESSDALWRRAGSRLAESLVNADASVVIADAGRFVPGSSVIGSFDRVLVLVHPVVEHLVTLGHRLPALRKTAVGDLGVVLVGSGPYDAEAVRDSLDIEVVASLPDDPRAAAMLIDGAAPLSNLGRTRLARAAAALGQDLTGPQGDRTTLEVVG